VVCQSTLPPDDAQELVNAIERFNPGADVRFVDTICHPTRARQEAIDELLERVEAVVVVGGHNSNNTRKLVRKSRDAGLPTLHIQDASGICAEWLAPFDRVGLTAGTSTPPETIEAVHQRLVELGVGRG
jgi:4-hydroxy-3-methylbut-2-enyl diphosphate reductase